VQALIKNYWHLVEWYWLKLEPDSDEMEKAVNQGLDAFHWWANTPNRIAARKHFCEKFARCR
jgi:transposase